MSSRRGKTPPSLAAELEQPSVMPSVEAGGTCWQHSVKIVTSPLCMALIHSFIPESYRHGKAGTKEATNPMWNELQVTHLIRCWEMLLCSNLSFSYAPIDYTIENSYEIIERQCGCSPELFGDSAFHTLLRGRTVAVRLTGQLTHTYDPPNEGSQCSCLSLRIPTNSATLSQQF